jgi:hypothetical protein
VASVTSATGADAAAGAEAGTITVPAGQRWLLKAVTVVCVQGATQTPWPTLTIDDGTNVLFAAKSGTAAQALDTTCRHSWAPNGPLTIAGATTAVIATGPLPADFVLEAGYRISTVTAGIGANTNYGVMRATIQKFPPGA